MLRMFAKIVRTGIVTEPAPDVADIDTLGIEVRRGIDRRSPQQSAEQGGRAADQVDVEQIMREIRARISQQHGIELSTQQIQDLALGP